MKGWFWCTPIQLPPCVWPPQPGFCSVWCCPSRPSDAPCSSQHLPAPAPPQWPPQCPPPMTVLLVPLPVTDSLLEDGCSCIPRSRALWFSFHIRPSLPLPCGGDFFSRLSPVSELLLLGRRLLLIVWMAPPWMMPVCHRHLQAVSTSRASDPLQVPWGPTGTLTSSCPKQVLLFLKAVLIVSSSEAKNLRTSLTNWMLIRWNFFH